MSFRLPSVIVYQELISTTVSPTTPFMDLCVVGPVYQCENGVSLPAYSVHTTEVSETGDKIYEKEFPNLKVGAIIDDASAYITLSNVNLKIWPTIAGTFENIIEVDNTGAVTKIKSALGATGEASLESANIQPDDQVDVTYTDPVTGEFVVKTASIHSVETDEAGNVSYNLKKTLILPTLPEGEYFKATVKRTIEGTHMLTPGGSSDAEAAGFTIKTDESGTKYVKLAVGGLRVASNHAADGQVLVVDCDVDVSYRALRTDVANDFITISSYSEALAQFGNPNIDNPMSVAAQIINSAIGSISYKVLPIASDDFNGYNQALDILTNSEKVYVIEPLSHDKQVIQAYVTHCKAMSEAEKSKWRIIYANMPMPATKIMVELNKGTLMTRGADTETELYAFQVSTTVLGAEPVYTKVSESGILEMADDTPTDKVFFNEPPVLNMVTGVKYTGSDYKVKRIIDQYPTSEEGVRTSPFKPEFDEKYIIVIGGEACVRDTAFDTSVVPADATCYIKDLDTNVGGFISSICRPTDYVDLYEVVGQQITYKYSLMVKQVLTDSAAILYTQKWLRDGDGYYMQDGEFQKFSHPKTEGQFADLTNCTYEVVRVLDTAGMAEALSGVAQSYKTKRLRYVQPDQIMVTVNGIDYLVGGEYLCVALGAMRAGLPPHQGFSTMGISGINRITRSNKMFNEDQLAEMASNGVFWVAQDSVDELPYVLYQTTTDTAQLETAEDSCVAVVDYASKYYKDNLKDVLGRYNVNTISLNYVKTVINACSNDMTTTSYEYIGPILTSATLTALVADGDKIKPTIKVQIPYPVNGVDITLQV